MISWYKSIWLRLRKSNQLPGNEVLLPMTPPPVEAKPRRVRKKKDVNNT